MEKLSNINLQNKHETIAKSFGVNDYNQGVNHSISSVTFADNNHKNASLNNYSH